MTSRRILMASPNYWDSPFQVGSHHLARGFLRAGWKVAYVSDPISPWHFLRGLTPDLRQRLANTRQKGLESADGKLWTYVPASFVTPHNKPFLRSNYVARNWHKWSLPSVVSMVRTKGFDSVDVLYIDSLSQSFWLDVVNYRKAVYRVADYNPHFEKYTPAMRTLEKEMARRADLVVYPSQNLKNYVSDLGARRSYCLPNGVDFDHFTRPMPAPLDYAELPGPVAVYVGVMPYWFHFDWLRQAARVLPEVSFVLIGPDDLAKYEFNGIANIHLLGLKNYATLPAFLQHANVGLMPFDLAKNPAGVNVLNPQKLYSYLASGLPVVSADWEEIRTVNSPAILCASAEQFIKGIRQALSDPGDPKSLRRYASKFDWNQRVPELLSVLARTDKACA